MSISAITKETRRLSYFDILKKCGARHKLIFHTLLYAEPMTANEITRLLLERGQISRFDRNFVAPRLHEMYDLGLVEILPKRKCEVSKKFCAVFAIPKEVRDEVWAHDVNNVLAKKD